MLPQEHNMQIRCFVYHGKIHGIYGNFTHIGYSIKYNSGSNHSVTSFLT